MNVERINSWSETEAHEQFLRCCGSRSWAKRMTASRPFIDENEVISAADEVWKGLTRTDWLEAFAAHPRIGDLDSLRKKFTSTADWSSGEQAGVAGAADDVLHQLAEGNRIFEERFGHIFIVCATGKSAGEMLALLRERLRNDADVEIRIAAVEQAKITRLRLEKL